jgi:hypothetical protein
MDDKQDPRDELAEQDGSLGLDEHDNNPEVKAWFQQHPTEAAALALPLEEKKSFILKYYSEDLDSDKLLADMLDEAEKILDKELADGKGKPPFSEALVLSMMVIAKAKIMDELLEVVSKLYEERRRLVKGKEIKDPAVIKFTQMNCSRLAFMIQTKILKQVEEEAKSRHLLVEEFVYYCVMVASNDMNTFVEVERMYNFRKTEQNKDKEFDRVKVKEYISESLKISEQILTGQLDSTVVFLFPHLLSDKLFNLTGFESEEVVYYIRKMVKENTIDEELVDLIVREAYSVEKSKENCHTTFENQMIRHEQQVMEAYARRAKEIEAIKDPLEDPAIKKMIETGLLSRKDAETIIKQHGQQGALGVRPEQMYPYFPGMFPPGAQPRPSPNTAPDATATTLPADRK